MIENAAIFNAPYDHMMYGAKSVKSCLPWNVYFGEQSF